MKFDSPYMLRSSLLFLLMVLLLPASGMSQKKKKKVKPDAIISTPYGEITLKLYDDTPVHRNNFLKLAKEGFYDGTTFHRVMKNFMIQGGDPYSKDPAKKHMAGQGGPGYTQPAEIRKGYIHRRGILAAARMPDPVNPKRESSGSQFYIVQGQQLTEKQVDQTEIRLGMTLGTEFKYTPEERLAYINDGGAPWLDQQYTIFGEVISGMDVVDEIADQTVGAGSRPNVDIPMTVVAKAKPKKIKKRKAKKKKEKKKKK